MTSVSPEAGAVSTRTVRIPVTGMTCAACSARVQRSLLKQPGVADASVNLMMHDATVTFDPATTSPDALVALIQDTGYGAELMAPHADPIAEQDARDAAALEEFRGFRLKAAVSGAVGAFMMFVAMPLMVPGWVQMLLAIGVMAWAGRHFYVRAWAALRHRAADMNTLIAVGTGSAFVYSVVATVAPTLFTSRGVAGRRVLRGGGRHHRAHPRRQRVRGARQDARTSSALRALAHLQPKTARVVRDAAGASTCRWSSCVAGDIVSVRPGERVPVDGVLVDGESAVDEVDAHRRVDAGEQASRRRA